VLSSALGTIKADVPIGREEYTIGTSVAFDLPRAAAVPLARFR
jgi:hypothetical protein